MDSTYNGNRQDPRAPSSHVSSLGGRPGSGPNKRKRCSSCSGARPIRRPRELGLMRDTSRSDMPRFVGSGSGIHFIRGVYRALAIHHAGRSRRTSPQPGNLVPGEDDQLGDDGAQGNMRSLWHPHEVSVSSTQAPPSFEQFVEWSTSFFELWHPALPFLHAPSVLEIFEKVSDHGIEAISDHNNLILRSVLSISLADSRQGPKFRVPIPSYLVFASIDDALSSIQAILHQPASLYLTQAAVGVQLFLMSMLNFNSASRLGGLIVRVSFHLGLHRCPARYPSFTPEDASIRRRLFWCIYILERRLCQSLGLPLDIRNDDVDVCYPGEELHEQPPHTTPHAARSEASRLRLMTYLAKHADITGLILELRNKSVNWRQDTPERVDHVSAELARWSNEIHDAVDMDFGELAPAEESYEDDSEIVLSPSHRLLLMVLKQESIISLNRPLMASDPESPSYAVALQNCIGAARTIVSLLSRFYDVQADSSDSEVPTLRVPIIWPSFPWAIWMSAFVLAYGTFEGHLPLTTFERHAEQSKKVLVHMAARDTSWPEYCRGAVENLVAAIQKHAHANDQLTMIPDMTDTTSFDDTSREPARTNREEYSSPHNSIVPTASRSVVDRMGQPCTQPRSTHRGATAGSGLHTTASYMQSENYDHQRYSASIPNLGQDNALGNLGIAAGTQSIDPTLGDKENFDLSFSWYSQAFADPFSAIDYPFLAVAQLDPSVDPILSFGA